MCASRRIGRALSGGAVVVACVLSPAMAQQRSSARVAFEPVEIVVGGGVAGGADCSQVATHTDANFTGGSYIVQAGFAEKEIAAATYSIPPTAFPIKVSTIEMIFATSNAVVPTTTQWTVMVWDGLPTGTPVWADSSDGEFLPHITMPPGTSGVNLMYGIDPGDPNQIVLDNPSGSGLVAVGFRIDKHNNQTQNPCFVGPSATANAFPTTDVSGLASPSGNWLFALNCGPTGCPPNGGWTTFGNLQPGCKPSGDWVLRMTWEPLTCSSACYANCNGDVNAQGQPVLNIDDFICFQLKYALGDPSADCDKNGLMNIDDFLCFQIAFALGC